MTGRLIIFKMSTEVSACCHKRVYESLCQERNSSVGFLLGFEENGQIIVLAWSSCRQGTDDIARQADDVSLLLPAGVSVVGIFYNSLLPATKENAKKNIVNLNTKQLQANTGHLLFLHKVKESTRFEDGPYIQTNSGEMASCSLTITEEDLFCKFQVLRLRTKVPLDVIVPPSSPKARNHIRQGINSLLREFQTTSSTAVFHVRNSSVLLWQSSDDVTSTPESCMCSDLHNYIDTEDDDVELKTKKKKKYPINKRINVSLHFQTTGGQAFQKTPSFSPVINYISEIFNNVSLMLPLDVVALVCPEVKCDKLWEILSAGVCRQLKAMESCLCDQVGLKEIAGLQTPVAYHFRPLHSHTLFTVIYPDGASEDQLQPTRKQLHETFAYPLDRPLFRRGNAFLFPEELDTQGYLRDPHMGITSSGVVGGKQYLIQGHYTYHHYMQDRFDDDKWGCAYRSLQTLISWFVLQGYSSAAIPTHREIQQALVDVGDKETKFVGSRQWIGSFEVSICLDHFLGVSSKIMSVSEGAELAYKGRELAAHFETQGTPVMIGGGVLAHTILGVDFNSETGTVKFLILDPHYTGAEDLKVILDKGWCGWKGPEFWDQKAHYNLCMPQRNIVI